MELDEKDEFCKKLIFLLREITECKSFESAFIEKVLANISHQLSNRQFSNAVLNELLKWLSEMLQKWRKNSPSILEVEFICQFVGILTKNEQGFHQLLKANILNDLCSVLQTLVSQKKAVISAYIKLLSDVLSIGSGYEWIKNYQQWKVVCSLYFSNSNLYVEREGENFLKNLIYKAEADEELTTEILHEIFLPVVNYNKANAADKKFCSYTLLLLKLLESLVKMIVINKKILFFSTCEKVFDIETFLNFLVADCKEESVVVAASKLQILFFVANSGNKKELVLSVGIPAVMEIFYNLIRKNQFDGFIQLSNYCQALLKKLECENKSGLDFIILQLLPIFMIVKPPDTALCDMYIQKVFSLTTEKEHKFCYLFRDEIKSRVGFKTKDLALKGVLSIMTNTECLKLEEAVIIFQAMVYSYKAFIENSVAGETLNEKSGKEQSLCIEDTQLFSAVLNVLSVFIKKFKINWSESLESLCLLKLTCIMLQSPDVGSIVVVQMLSLVKLSILNFMSPDLALLINNTKDSAFDYLIPLLHKRLHDPNWEVRDSCLEVVTAIAELSESKYPAFQQLLLEKNFHCLAVSIMEGDGESYVRASAIQALTAMTKIETLNQLLLKMDLPRRIIKLLQNESEAIVRREAALLIKQIFLTLNDTHSDIVNSLYEIMGYLAISDLHWEVKVNSLIFWEAVIQHTMADQGMIDGSFPKVTFSKEHKKIVALTEKEIKLRLDKVLIKLSNIGCLYVLLCTLNDDCEMPVIKKSAQILMDLIKILKNYGVMKSDDFPIGDIICMKRKNTVFYDFEKRKSPNLLAKETGYESYTDKTSENFNERESCSSDVVIDGIVNESDINLLVGVSAPNKEIVSLQKKILLQKIKPEAFVSEMQDFNLESFLDEKEKLQSIDEDLKSLISKLSTVNLAKETNIMDCY